MSKKEDREVRAAVTTVQAEKKTLEGAILDALTAFSERTNLPVDSLDVSCMVNSTIGGTIQHIAYFKLIANIKL